MSKNKSIVYFKKVDSNTSYNEIAQINLKVIESIHTFSKIKPKDLVAIKLHFGDEGNTGHIKPNVVKVLGDAIKAQNAKPFLVETSTLYVGRRSNAYDHMLIAYEHGFTYENTGLPIIMADGILGQSQTLVKINGIHFKELYVAADVPHYDFIIFLNHVTGHILTGMGAAIKNMGMGLTARGGKLSQHSGVLPSIDTKKCILCGRCVKFCPNNAISKIDEKFVIDHSKCIGCGECLSVCKQGAVKYSWKQSSKIVQEKMAEYALGVVFGKQDKVIFVNHIIDVTSECDCMAKDEKRIFENTGILASTDPVAIDKATLDIVKKYHNHSFNGNNENELNPMHQIEHGAKIGLGSMDYELIEL